MNVHKLQTLSQFANLNVEMPSLRLQMVKYVMTETESAMMGVLLPVKLSQAGNVLQLPMLNQLVIKSVVTRNMKHLMLNNAMMVIKLQEMDAVQHVLLRPLMNVPR